MGNRIIYADSCSHTPLNPISDAPHSLASFAGCVPAKSALEKLVRMVKPTVDEVSAYIRGKGYAFDASQFVSYYEAHGWRRDVAGEADFAAAAFPARVRGRKHKQRKENQDESKVHDGEGAGA